MPDLNPPSGRIIVEPIPESSTARRGVNWKFALLGGLAAQGVPRIFSAAEFHQFIQSYRQGASAATARDVAAALISAGALRRVSSGLFLNRRGTPLVELSEAASRLRAGAVISLHSVLGECGFLNNPAAIVTAVLPTSPAKRPRLGETITSSGDVFRFYGVGEKFFPVTPDDSFELLQPGRACDMFRPEAAFLQWLHLGSMERSTLTLPPMDVDMAQLDLELLNRLAARWSLERHLDNWMKEAQRVNFGEEPDVPLINSPTSEDLDASSAARARLMAKKNKP